MSEELELSCLCGRKRGSEWGREWGSVWGIEGGSEWGSVWCRVRGCKLKLK